MYLYMSIYYYTGYVPPLTEILFCCSWTSMSSPSPAWARTLCGFGSSERLIIPLECLKVDL